MLFHIKMVLWIRGLFDFELLIKRFTIVSSVALVNGNFKMKLFQGNLLRKLYRLAMYIVIT